MKPLTAEQLRNAADRFAPLVLSGLLSRREVQYTLRRCTLPSCDLEIYALTCLDDALMRPGMLASWDIRQAIGPLMSRRAQRAELLLAAYRAADGRLNATDAEAVVKEETTAYVRRARGN